MWHVNGNCKYHLSGIEVRIEVEAAKKLHTFNSLKEHLKRKAKEVGERGAV